MERHLLILWLAAALITLAQCGGGPPPPPMPVQPTPAANAADFFVERHGNRLSVNGQPFRFAGTNVYWIGLDENVGGVDYPTTFRVNDALATAKEMGATVIRAHAAVSVGCARCIKPDLASVNEAALAHVDYAVMAARQYGLRLILPLVDNYAYYHGGSHTFTDWRGLPKDDFYTNRQVIADFKAYVAIILNRVNTYTGVAYKDDPTIMAWETGNELRPPTKWTGEIADFVKGIAPRQLVADGNVTIDSAALSILSVDMYSLHFYPMDRLVLVRSAEQVTAAGKVFFVGEFDWNNAKGGDSLARFLSAIRDSQTVAGDLYWTLFGHSDNYGYVNSNGDYKLHYPGETVNMRERAQLLRAHAFAMRGLAPPAHSPPAAPQITRVGAEIAWRGVAGADTYTVERASAGPDGPWQVICDRCASDYDTPWQIPAPITGPAWYRVRAYNLDGLAGPYSPPQTASP
jgi:hypothetical protein